MILDLLLWHHWWWNVLRNLSGMIFYWKLSLLDSLRFAYQARRGVEDASSTLLNGIMKHVRLLFVDFSSAFNTIQPHVLVNTLISEFKLEFKIVGWLIDFLSDRIQRVRVNRTFSDTLITSTVSPQGCVLSPLLYILYTTDCVSRHRDRFILKFTDDTVIVSLLTGDENSHGPVVNDFLTWCDSALQVNIKKTKVMVTDFRSSPSPQPTRVKGQMVEWASSYKYLVLIIDNKLRFDTHVE